MTSQVDRVCERDVDGKQQQTKISFTSSFRENHGMAERVFRDVWVLIRPDAAS